jgi:hypothetical protein
MRSMLATEVPPNFITTVAILNGFLHLLQAHRGPEKDLSSLVVWIESRLLSGSRGVGQLRKS